RSSRSRSRGSWTRTPFLKAALMAASWSSPRVKSKSSTGRGFPRARQRQGLDMNLSELCIRRPVFTTLITATFIVFGIFAYRLLPVAALPAVDCPTIAVTAALPGASAENMAVAVAAPIERQMATISGISSLSSVSTLGRSQINILFNLNRNIDGAALDVQTALTIAQRRLPVE